MSKNEMKAAPKQWEVGLSSLLCAVLPVARLFVIVYMVMLCISSKDGMPWMQLGLQTMLLVAIHYSNKNFQNVIKEVQNATSDGGE